ncbi:carboxypeptidase-like regulatory domain-containing protein [Maribacter sp. 2308TA10-17]|uniref:carboxypeptidase-like regulatory domain-containing protein n=1 Tax=Maribacter sp. 2308TA10-17 TaxID=3386276 RepID=UPI0039BD25D5
MKKLLYLFSFVSWVGFAQETDKTIFGKVTDGVSPLRNVAITINDSPKAIFTDESGKYRIEAKTNDNITYSFQGFKTIKIKVEDVTRILNINMVLDVQELEEVTVLGSNRKSQQELELEYGSNLNIIRTAFGYLNADTAAGNIRFLNSEEINPVTLCILDLLRNQFSGIRVQGECSGAFGPTFTSLSEGGSNLTGRESDNDAGVIGLITASGTGVNSNLNQGKVFVRGNSSLLNPRSAIFDLDGQILNDPPLWLDIRNIKRLAILNNFAASTQYGNAGAGGVIVINTISASPKSNKIYDQARLRNNFASKNMISKEDLKNNWPSYLSEIYASESLSDAKGRYEKYASAYKGHPYFALDMQKYFKERWGDSNFSNEIIENSSNLFEKNPVLLKALAYQLESLGEYEEANKQYKEVLRLRPTYLQSYLDMANSYRDTRKTQQAASIYARYNFLMEEGLLKNDSIGFSVLFEREYNNFLLLDKNSILDANAADDLYIAEEEFQGTRLVFEWNDSEAEFELQFVNPKNQYFMLKHSLADNDALISREKEYGYSTAEYLIDGSLPGTWKVNVNYLGNKSLTPTYLKATVYYNYGSYAQRKETKVFKLDLKNVPHELFTVSVGAKLAFNE